MADGFLDNVGRNIAVIGSIVAAIVGMNTALTTCSAQTIAHHETFRQAVDAEEQYWRGLYSDYLGTFGRNVETDEREARLFALRVLAERQIPNFDEYSLGYFGGGEGAKTLAKERLATMKGRLQEALSRKESSTPAVAARQQEQTFLAAVQNVRTVQDRNAEQAAPQPIVVSDAAPDSSGVSYQTQLLATGDAKGWDFDVFWCGGGETAAESANYRAGLAAARALADRSTNGTGLAGQKLGRVRLVMLPEQRQGANYPARGFGNELRSDTQTGERRLAQAVLGAIPGGKSYRLILNDPPPSRFYLSLFACAVGRPPEGRPPPETAATAS